MTTPAATRKLIDGLTWADILRAAADIVDGKKPAGFRNARGWKLEIAGKLFPHRQVIAAAVLIKNKKKLSPTDFDGNGWDLIPVFKKLGFKIRKGGS